MSKLTTAQQLLVAFGVEPQLVLLGHHKVANVSHTKRGPGRRQSIQH